MFLRMHRVRKDKHPLEMIVQSSQIAAVWEEDGRTLLIVAGGAGALEVAEPMASVIEACGTSVQTVPGFEA